MKINEVRDEMAEAHRRDYDDKHKMRELRETIEAFLGDPPPRCTQVTRGFLASAIRTLAENEAHVVSVWD